MNIAQRILRAPATHVGLLVLAVLVVHAVNIGHFPTANDDEGTYLAQAYAVRQGWGLAHYTYWYDHPPFAWIQLALVSWVPEALFPSEMTVGAGRLAMLPVTAVSMVLVYAFTRRLGNPRWVALLALGLYGLSPLSSTLMRQVFLDGFAVMWILAAFVLALSRNRHLWHYLAAGVAAGFAVLSKETILILVPAVIWALWQGSERTVRRFSMAGFVSAFLMTCSFYPLYALLNSEFLPGDDHVSLLGALGFQLANREGSGSILDGQTLSNELFMSWLHLDSVLLVGGLLATIAGVFIRRLRPAAIAVLIGVAVGLRPGGYLPAMYVLQLLPFLAVVLAGSVGVAVVWFTAQAPQWTSRVPTLPAALTRLGLTRSGVARAGVAAVLAVAAFAAAGFIAPRWHERHAYAMTATHHDTYIAAATWLKTQVPDRAQTTVVADDTLWLDLVRAGYEPDRVIWFYKLDVDPEVTERIPGGWRDVSYIAATPVMRGDQDQRPTLAALLQNSTVVASFGDGDGRIDIRRVEATS